MQLRPAGRIYGMNIANAWVDRQNILDPLEAFLCFNGVAEDIEGSGIPLRSAPRSLRR